MTTVCPACAGMIRHCEGIIRRKSRLPRMRGDDPYTRRPPVKPMSFAPHARG